MQQRRSVLWLSETYVVTDFGKSRSINAMFTRPYISAATSKSHISIVLRRKRSRWSSMPPRRGRESTA